MRVSVGVISILILFFPSLTYAQDDGWYKIEKITGSCDPEAQALAIYVQNAMPISIAVSGGPNGEVIDPKPISKSPTVFRVDYEYSFITSATIKSLSSKRFVIHAQKGRCAGAEFTFRAG
ncbi:MAG: hypothetical protein KGO21_00700 [Hyphomicrobiales bacterium]|nr:hypothetical protein [Hyphomicrobiales bacterium]